MSASSRGGRVAPGRARRTRRVGRWLAITAGLGVGVLGSGCGAAEAPTDPATARAGAAVFTSAGCGACHTLAVARASGNIGPNLDRLRPDAGRVAGQVREGGNGMPAYADRLSAREIDAVAAFVARAAGMGR